MHHGAILQYLHSINIEPFRSGETCGEMSRKKRDGQSTCEIDDVEMADGALMTREISIRRSMEENSRGQ